MASATNSFLMLLIFMCGDRQALAGHRVGHFSRQQNYYKLNEHKRRTMASIGRLVDWPLVDGIRAGAQLTIKNENKTRNDRSFGRAHKLLAMPFKRRAVRFLAETKTIGRTVFVRTTKMSQNRGSGRTVQSAAVVKCNSANTKK